MADLSRIHVVVYGIVQGVSFRYHTRRVARGLLLTGWVRNRPDDTVEVMAEGPRPQLETLLAYLRQGPEMARVDHAAVEWATANGEFISFDIVK